MRTVLRSWTPYIYDNQGILYLDNKTLRCYDCDLTICDGENYKFYLFFFTVLLASL